MDITAIRKPVFNIDIPTIGKIPCRTCTVADHRRLLVMRDLRNVLERVSFGDIPQTLKTVEIIWAKMYLKEIESYCRKNPDALMIPTQGGAGDGEKCLLDIFTSADKLVADYAHLSFIEILEIDIIDYRLLAADAYKHMILTNKVDGIKYLNGCYCNMHNISSAEKLTRKNNTEVMITEV